MLEEERVACTEDERLCSCDDRIEDIFIADTFHRIMWLSFIVCRFRCAEENCREFFSCVDNVKGRYKLNRWFFTSIYKYNRTFQLTHSHTLYVVGWKYFYSASASKSMLHLMILSAQACHLVMCEKV